MKIIKKKVNDNGNVEAHSSPDQSHVALHTRTLTRIHYRHYDQRTAQVPCCSHVNRGGRKEENDDEDDDDDNNNRSKSNNNNKLACNDFH